MILRKNQSSKKFVRLKLLCLLDLTDKHVSVRCEIDSYATFQSFIAVLSVCVCQGDWLHAKHAGV